MTRKAHTLAELESVLRVDTESGTIFWRERGRHRALDKQAGKTTKLGYRAVSVNSRLYAAHRLVWLFEHGEWPSLHIDHINGDRCDNRIRNLRLATPAQNAWNSDSVRSLSGFRGVTWIKGRSKWRVTINANKQRHYLGLFTDITDAARAYEAAAERLYGEFRRATQ